MTKAVDLRDLLEYCQKSGKLFWKNRQEQNWIDKRFNKNFAGKEAGTEDKNGYRVIQIANKNFLCHRIVWFLVYGTWPSEGIDHINGDKSDNRVANLREANQTENLRNSKIRKDNSSGCVGVDFRKDKRRWRASIMLEGKSVHLGYFKTKDEAVVVRKSAEKTYGFHENHGRVGVV